ncbi:MAG: single-stranded-DNA-specific exonuclease RecJ [Chloroflexi bacterium]|nr:single-stranded-DNA-specific exonuclease RecJ [Chloroflexota bacterium]
MKHWKLKDLSAAESRNTLPGDLSPAIARVLLARGIDSSEKLQLFLNPPHRLPHCPMRLEGMESALQLLNQTINSPSTEGTSKLVGIVGDFDVDGITGTAILTEVLTDFGLDALPYLPDRVAEGHGLSEEAVRYFSGLGARLIITVDCGVSSRSEVALANSLGLKVIVTDHHVPPADPPKAFSIINPGVPGNQYPFPELCGAGLALKLAQGLYQLRGLPTPRPLLELAALGTIADMVPLVDENRFLVTEGLAELSRTRRPGLIAMYKLAGLEDKPITADTVAFQIAPRLNAAGRMGHAGDSLKLLITSDENDAEALAHKLEAQNRERRDLTLEAFEAASRKLSNLESIPPFILIDEPAVTPGVAGLVAGKLARQYQRPAVALASAGEDILIGSGRSIPAFNLVQAFDQCSNLFLRHGGHSQAAGFTIHRENVRGLQTALSKFALERLAEKDLEPVLEIDAEIELSDLTPKLLSELETLEPFGVANPRPVFLSRGLHVDEIYRIGNAGQHLKLMVNDGGKRFPALAFDRASEWESGIKMIDLAYTISADVWRGRTRYSLVVEDYCATD